MSGGSGAQASCGAGGGAGGGGAEQRGFREAGVPVATLGVDDLEARAAPRRPEVVAVDDDLGLLADDVAAESEPRPTREIEPQPDQFTERPGHARRQARRLEDDEQRVGATRECGEPMETIGGGRGTPALLRAGGQRRRLRKPTRQVDDEDVDRAALKQGTRHREALVQ